VQFTAAQNNGGDSPSIDIGIEASDDAATFAGTTSEIGTRVLDPTPPVNWAPGTWTSNAADRSSKRAISAP
jgi:hypothetical protein